MTAKFRNIKLTVSVWFAAMITIICLFAPQGSALTGLFCCMAHETGHLIFIKLFGAQIKSVAFGVYGMRIETGGNLRLSHQREAMVSFAGPAVNIVFAFAGLLLNHYRFMYINIALALLNLLPAGKTDGWSILYNLIVQKLDESKTETVLKIIGTVFLIVFYFFGFTVLIKSGFNFSLIAVAVYITVIFLMH